MLGILLITALTAVQYPTTTSAQPAAPAAPAARDTAKSAVVSRVVFHDTMRQLWEEHILYTRNFIISTAAGLPDASQVTQRLLRNQTELGDAIKPYYGEVAGAQLTALLRSHILGAAKVVAVAQGSTPTARSTEANPMYPAPAYQAPAAVKSSVTATMGDTAKANASAGATATAKPAATTDTTALNSALAAWRANGDSIATFLSTANARNWPRTTLQTVMRMHLDLTLQEATARLRGDWSADIAAFDEVHRHALAMADVLSEGIMKQFPNRFTTKSTAVSSLR